MKKVYGYHIGKKIDIKRLKNTLVYETLHHDQTEVFYKTEDSGLIYILNYGSVVFMDVPQGEQISILQSIREILDIPAQEPEIEVFDIEIDPQKDYQALFNKLILKRFNINTAQVIMLNLAQSVAMDFYTKHTEALLSETREYTNELENIGKLNLKGKKLLKYLGRALNLKNSIAENLYIFDSPQIAWEDQELNKIDEDLSRELDVKLRYKSVQENLSIIKENLDLFMDVSNHAHSSLLEWIIIILIFIEIINMAVEKLMLLHK